MNKDDVLWVLKQKAIPPGSNLVTANHINLITKNGDNLVSG